MSDVVFKNRLENSNSKSICKAFPGLIDFLDNELFCGKCVFMEDTSKFGITHPSSTFFLVFSYWFDTLTIQMRSTDLTMINEWTYTKPDPTVPVSSKAALSLGRDIYSALKEQEGFAEYFKEHVKHIKAY